MNRKKKEVVISHDMGYVKINGVYEHRIVATKMLGRQLKPNEIVHHRNGIRTDNRPENLFIFPDTQSHIKYHWYLQKNGHILEEEFMKL